MPADDGADNDPVLKAAVAAEERAQALSCAHVETHSLETSSSHIDQTADNLIDLDEEASASCGGAGLSERIDISPMDAWEVALPQAPSKWTRGELVGAGAYGKVYLGLNQETGQLMAVKQVSLISL